MKPLTHAASLALLCLPLLAIAHGRAHEHGVVSIDIAIEPGRIEVLLHSPMDSFVGFERAPRNDAERQRLAAALTRLRAVETVFVIDPAAGCQPTHVDIEAPESGTGQPGPADGTAEHADIDVVGEFACRDASKATFVDVRLFDAFPHVRRVVVQVAGPKGQTRHTLHRPAHRVDLTR